MSGYVQSVRRALRGRDEEYRQFVDVVADLRRSVAAPDADDVATEKVVSQIETAVSLLDGQPELIAGLRMFLPSQYCIDIQADAVVIKVTVLSLYHNCDSTMIRLRYDDTTTQSTTTEVIEITICVRFDCDTTTTRLRRKIDMFIFCSRRMEAGARDIAGS